MAVFFLLSLGFLMHYFVVGQAVYGDGRYYYSMTRSIWKDHDINFLNEYQHHWSPKNNNTNLYDYLEGVDGKTSTGLYPNKYSLGGPILWLIPFAFADLSAKILGFPSQGYSDIYQVLVGIFICLLSTFSIYLLYKFLLKYFEDKISKISCFLILFGSNLFFYTSLDVINSHAVSFFGGVLFLTYWYSTIYRTDLKRWAIIGFLLGFLTLTRNQEIVFSVLFLAENLIFIYRQKQIKIGVVVNLIIRNIVSVLFFLVAFSPQLILWKMLYGSFYKNPYLSEGFNFLRPAIFQILLSQKVGLFIWTPIFAIGIAGLFLLLKNKKLKELSIFSLIITLSQIYVIASWSSWFQGESYGLRMLISSIPFLTIGLSNVLSSIQKKHGYKIVYSFTLFFIILNFASILYFLLFFKNPTYDIGQNTQKREFQRINLLLKKI